MRSKPSERSTAKDMDTNNEKQLGIWVDEHMYALSPGNNWQPNVSAGLVRLKELQRRGRSFTRRWFWAAATTAAICLFLLVLPSPKVLAHKCLECTVAVWQSLASSGSAQTSVKPPEERKIAPDFELKDSDGKDLRLSNLKGKVILVNFWATWCEGCQVEIPWFVEFEKSYADRGLVVVGVSMDDDGWKSVRPWIKEKKVNYPIVIGDEGLGKQYGLEGMPLTVLVDREGKIADVHAGVVNKADTEKKILALLDENPKRPSICDLRRALSSGPKEI